MNVADGEPKRCRAHGGRAFRDCLHKTTDEVEDDESGGDREQEDAGHAMIVGKQHGEGAEDSECGPRAQEIGPARPGGPVEAQLPEEGGCGHVSGAAERRERKGEGDQEPENGRLKKRCRIKGCLAGDWQNGGQGACRKEGDRCTDHEPDQDARRGDQHHLDQIDENDEAGGGADAFERGDDAALAVDEGAHGIGHAHAADNQGCQTDECQELREALDVVGQRGGCVVARAHGPARIGEIGLGCLGNLSGGLIAIEPDAVGIFDNAAGADEAGSFKPVHRDHQPWRKSESLRQRVGFVGDLGAQFELRAPHRDAVADLYTEALEEDGGCDRAVDSVGFGQRCLRRNVGRQAECAIKRIGTVERAQFDERLVALVGGARHRAHAHAFGHISEGFYEFALAAFGGLADRLEADVAAEDRPAFGADRFRHHLRDGIHARDRHGAQKHTGEEDVETRKSATHFAQRQSHSEG